jgi:histidine triad (HIT) family protein
VPVLPLPELDERRVAASNALCLFLTNGNPIPGVSGINVPRGHKRDVSDPSRKEWAAGSPVLAEVKRTIDRELAPNGYDVGWNCGVAAGQEMFHAHMHLIPAFGDELRTGKGIRYRLKQEPNLRKPAG